jgi:hypothetical protein
LGSRTKGCADDGGGTTALVCASRFGAFNQSKVALETQAATTANMTVRVVRARDMNSPVSYSASMNG